MKFKIFTKKRSYRLDCPSGWNDLTVKQLEMMERDFKGDLVQLFALWTGVPFDELVQSKEKGLEVWILKALSWIYKKHDWIRDELPKAIKINGRKLFIHKDLDDCCLGAKMIVLRKMVKEPGISWPLAAYLCKSYYGGAYTDEKAEAMRAVILEQKASRLFQIGSFFLQKLDASILTGQMPWKWHAPRAILYGRRLWRTVTRNAYELLMTLFWLIASLRSTAVYRSKY